MSKFSIEDLLDEVVTLPSMPEALLRINELLEDPNCQMADVAKIISGDPAIALKTLRLVNSAYYGLGQEVTSVEHAVVLLGVRVIKNLVITATVFAAIEGAAERFLCHSISTGVAMRILAKEGTMGKSISSPDEAFIFGLLHDIGKVLLSEFLSEEYNQVDELVEQGGLNAHEAEMRIIGVSHDELGARLAEKWKLSPVLIEAIGCHHNFSAATPELQSVTANLMVADYLCNVAGLGCTLKTQPLMNASIWEASGFDATSISRITENFLASLKEIDELLELAY